MSLVQLLSCVWLFPTPWTVAHQSSLSFTISQSLLRFMSIETVMPPNHLILCSLFSFCLQSFPASGSFPMSQLFFASGGQSIVSSVSASDLPMSIQGWFPDSAPSVAAKPFGLLYVSSSLTSQSLTRVHFGTSYTDAGGKTLFIHFFFSSKWHVYPDWKSGDKLGGCGWTGRSPSRLLVLAPLCPWERLSSYTPNHWQDPFVPVLQTRLAPVPWTLCHG